MSAVTRTPVMYSTAYRVQGLPEIADRHFSSRTIAPAEITLTYSLGEGPLAGRVHAYVSGTWMENGEAVPRQKPVGCHFWKTEFETWPAWLQEEARLHNPGTSPSPGTTREEAALELGREALSIGLEPFLKRLVGQCNAERLLAEAGAEVARA